MFGPKNVAIVFLTAALALSSSFAMLTARDTHPIPVRVWSREPVVVWLEVTPGEYTRVVTSNPSSSGRFHNKEVVLDIPVERLSGPGGVVVAHPDFARHGIDFRLSADSFLDAGFFLGAVSRVASYREESIPIFADLETIELQSYIDSLHDPGAGLHGAVIWPSVGHMEVKYVLFDHDPDLTRGEQSLVLAAVLVHELCHQRHYEEGIHQDSQYADELSCITEERDFHRVVGYREGAEERQSIIDRMHDQRCWWWLDDYTREGCQEVAPASSPRLLVWSDIKEIIEDRCPKADGASLISADREISEGSWWVRWNQVLDEPTTEHWVVYWEDTDTLNAIEGCR